MAIVAALQSEEDVRPPPVKPRPSNLPNELSGVSQGNPTDARQTGGVNFNEIDRLTRQISQEATIQDDDNDPSVETDPDLLVRKSKYRSLF